MSKFMTEDSIDSAAYFFRRAAAHLNGTLVYADLVGQDEPIVVGALGLWNAVVETQQLSGMAHASQPHRSSIWPILDDHFDVVQFVLELFGQFVEGLGHEMFKGLPIHTSTL
jgi:hypothetical protein